MNKKLQKNFNRTSPDPTRKLNKIQPDSRDRQRKAISAMYSLFPYKVSSGLFRFQIKTTTKPIKNNLTITVIHIQISTISNKIINF